MEQNLRQLIPLGKITVIKTLVISKISHLFITLPDPPEQFLKNLNSLLFNFLWDGKPSKIKKTVVCQPFEDGGLDMLDVYNFLSCMKNIWLHRISVCDSIFKTIMINMYPELDTLKIHGSEYANILMTKLNNPFWRDVLKHFKKLYARCSPQNTDEFMAECLHHNPNIIRENKVVYLKNWLDSGIVFIRHIIDVDGK